MMTTDSRATIDIVSLILYSLKVTKNVNTRAIVSLILYSLSTLPIVSLLYELLTSALRISESSSTLNSNPGRGPVWMDQLD